MSKYLHRSNVALMFLVALGLVLSLVATQVGNHASAQTVQFGDPNFQLTWNRTDLPVQQGVVSRSWYWGPLTSPTRITFEQYVDAPDGTGKRLVQYFDKSRMEINDPNADRHNPFFVTNGLLTVELITGRMQIGNNTFVQRDPANIDIASDVNDANAPTYVSFQGVISLPSGDRTGQYATQTINRAGEVGNDPSKASVPGTQFVHYEGVTQHNIPKVMWDFLNEVGPVYVNGQFVQQRLNDPWFYASGYPIAEPFWASVTIAGVANTAVLIQPYQRRVLTYVPSAPTGFKVQMGNIGQHYYDWRYGQQPPATATPGATTPTATPGIAPTPTATPKPIGGKIVYTSDMSDTKFLQIYSIKADGGSRGNLTHDQSNNTQPAWSPDGTKVAFVSDRDNGVNHIFVMNADGSNPIELNKNFPSKQQRPRWSPDGTRILFTGVDASAFPDGEIFVTEALAGVDPVRLTENNFIDTDADWSPDGSKIVFSSNRDGTQSLYTMNADGSNVKRITSGTNGTADIEPRWSPQGNIIVYRSGDPANADIYTVNVDGSNKQKIVNNTTNDWDPGFNSDGTRIIFMRQLVKQQLYIMHADGLGVAPVANQVQSVNNSQPDWFDK